MKQRVVPRAPKPRQPFIPNSDVAIGIPKHVDALSAKRETRECEKCRYRWRAFKVEPTVCPQCSLHDETLEEIRERLLRAMNAPTSGEGNVMR